MIQESGVYFPFKLFRRKTSAEMVRCTNLFLNMFGAEVIAFHLTFASFRSHRP